MRGTESIRAYPLSLSSSRQSRAKVLPNLRRDRSRGNSPPPAIRRVKPFRKPFSAPTTVASTADNDQVVLLQAFRPVEGSETIQVLNRGFVRWTPDNAGMCPHSSTTICADRVLAS